MCLLYCYVWNLLLLQDHMLRIKVLILMVVMVVEVVEEVEVEVVVVVG